jgi:hypothetical protein
MRESRKRFRSLASSARNKAIPQPGLGPFQRVDDEEVDMTYLSRGTFDFLVHAKSENFTRV